MLSECVLKGVPEDLRGRGGVEIWDLGLSFMKSQFEDFKFEISNLKSENHHPVSRSGCHPS